MISLIEDFNQIRLHDPYSHKHIMDLYNHIPEIKELDNRGFELNRPLFSHSELPNFMGIKEVKVKDFKWDQNFLYSVLLHHNNDLAAKHLDIIPEYILEEVRNKKCKLILDNVLEGHNIENFLKLLYFSIRKLKLPANQIFYVTNNLVAEDIHKIYLEDNHISNSINVVSFMYNVFDAHNLMQRFLYHNPIIKGANYRVDDPYRYKALPEIVDISKEIEYKKNNLTKIKHFLKINRTNREERNVFMLFLNHHKLIDKSLISFPDFPEEYVYPQEVTHLTYKENIDSLNNQLPFDIDETDRSNHGPAGFGLNEFDADLPFNPIHYKNSFVSIVMCAFPFVPNACHLHSSTFNPIYCGHPVIQFGPFKHLDELKKRGFKTFNKWWDESYDDIEDPWQRLLAIMDITLQLSKKTTKEMLEMYIDMQGVLQHNSNLIKKFNGKKVLRERIL